MVVAIYSAPALDQDGHSFYINDEVMAPKTGPSSLVVHGQHPLSCSALEGPTAMPQCFHSLITSLEGILYILT